jgi:type IV pilus assembly protein PilN
MIKINLLPYRAQRKRQRVVEHLIIAGLACLPAIMGIFISFLVINLKISGLDDAIASTAQEIKRQQATVEKIKVFKDKKEALLKKMDIIKTLQKNKSGPVHILDQLAVNLPGKLWLFGIKQTGMNLNLEGYALDNQSISRYMINLEKSPYFKSVDLGKISTEEQKGVRIPLKKYSLKCQITYTGK